MTYLLDTDIIVYLLRGNRSIADRIAAVAVAVDGVLVTNNGRHFSRIDGLIVENWLPS